MPELTKYKILLPVGGLSHDIETDGSKLGEHTINFYPDTEGYLVNYPGKFDYFRKEFGGSNPISDDSVDEETELVYPVPSGSPDGSSYSHPPVSDNFTRVKLYRDSSNQQHIVFVMDKKLCVVEGNGYKVLFNFKGQARDEVCYPDIFIHQNYLIIANLGDPILLWDGYNDVCPLGVTECPEPPSVEVSRAPWYTNLGQRKNIENELVMCGTGWEGGEWSKYGYWGNQAIWPSGPIEYEPGGHYEGLIAPGELHDPANWNDTSWRWKVRYFDKYGNLGPISQGTGTVTIPKNVALMTQPAAPGSALDERASLRDWDGKSFATVYWKPPRTDWHIAGAILYKTLDLHPSKGNSREVFYRDHVEENISKCRHTSVKGDSAISTGSAHDSSVSGPPSTDLAASWNNRVLVRDPESKEKLLYSEAGSMGEFRSSNVYIARDTIEAVLPLGDRLLVVTRSTSEVLYYNRNGQIQHLETYENKGTSYGPSFAVFSDQAFGLFNDGFFRFDGQKFIRTNSPYYLQGEYIDQWHEIQSSVVDGEWYFMSTRTDFTSENNDRILMCHLPTSRWFQVKESATDLAVIGDYIVGVSDSIHILYNGDTYEDSVIHLPGILDEGITREKTLSSLSLLLEPASKNKVDVTITGSDSYAKKYGNAKSYPSKSTVTKDVEYYPSYNDGQTSWHTDEQSENEYDWVSPNDFYVRVNLANNITDFKHDVKFSFKGPQRIRAVLVEYSAGSQVADKK